MKFRILNIITSLFVTACIFTSCLDGEYIEYDYSSNASITAFSITDSIVTYRTSVINNKDTTISSVVYGYEYPFVINQKEGLIYNPDSLPVGTDISKVVVNIVADSYYVYIAAETDSIWEATDSLNFKRPIQFKVLSESGNFGRTYTANINVHKQVPEKLTWKELRANFSTDIQAQKAIYNDGRIYVFAEKEEQIQMTMTETSNGKTWSALENIDIPIKADYSSAMAWNNQLYILADNQLYKSTNGLNWTKVESTQTITRLLANIDSQTNKKLLGVDAEGHFIESTDGTNWVQHGVLPTDFPKGEVSSATYPLNTNENISRIVLLSESNINTDTISTVWTCLDSDLDWIELSMEDSYACPNFENPSMIRYNNRLYAFGGPAHHNGAIKAFSSFYESKDNGISWSIVTENVLFPETFTDLYEQSAGEYSCTVDENHFIWIMWSRTGEVWKGRINQLGFKK